MLNFKGIRFPIDVILVCIRWYVAYPLSYRQLEEIMEERSVSVDHSSINRWAIRFLPLIEKLAQKHKCPVGGSWRMDETYKVSSSLQSTTYPVDRSGYYVEFEPALVRDLEKFTFESAIAQLVDALRKECEYVVTSCEFEDFIVEQTGWNWTLESPLSPRQL